MRALTKLFSTGKNNFKIHYYDVIKHRFTYCPMAQISNLKLWWAVLERSLIYQRSIPLISFSNCFLQVWDGLPPFLVLYGFQRNAITVGFLLPFLRIYTNHLLFLLCISPMSRSCLLRCHKTSFLIPSGEWTPKIDLRQPLRKVCNLFPFSLFKHHVLVP